MSEMFEWEGFIHCVGPLTGVSTVAVEITNAIPTGNGEEPTKRPG